jgi:hypothetical protein
LILNLIIFFAFYLLVFFSIYSYGFIFRKYFFKNEISLNENVFINIFFGLGFFIVFSWIYHISGLKNEWLNLSIFIIGGIIFFNKRVRPRNLLFFLVLPLILFSGLVIFKGHNDFHLYHFQNIIELTDENPKIGIGNLSVKYIYNSLYIYFESILSIPNYKFQFFNIPRFLGFLAICGYLLLNIIEKNNFDKSFISSVILVFFLIKFRRFSEHGYDYLVIFFTTFIFIEYFYRNLKDQTYLKSILFLFSITCAIKVTGLFFLPFIFFIIYKTYFKMKKKIFYKSFFPSFFVGLIFLINSFFNSGCIFYPFKSTCFNSNTIPWAVNYKMIDLEKKVSSKWAKGFYHQKENPKILSYQSYKKNFNWISSWYQSHFKSKMLEPCLIFILILYIFYFSSKKTNKNNFFKYNKVNLILFFFSILLWLFLLPQFRFGYSYIILFIFLALNFSFNYEPKLNKFSFVIIIFSLLFFNLSNFQRVKDEYYKNEYFPFYQTIFFKTYSLENNEVNYKIYKKNSKGERIPIVTKTFNPQYNVKYSNDYALKIDSFGYIKIISAHDK